MYYQHELQEVEQKFGERDREVKELKESKKKVLNSNKELEQEIERLEVCLLIASNVMDALQCNDIPL